MNFDDAFVKLIGFEGGYVNNPADPGGETKYGISRRAYPGEDIANMTVERATLRPLGCRGCGREWPPPLHQAARQCRRHHR